MRNPVPKAPPAHARALPPASPPSLSPAGERSGEGLVSVLEHLLADPLRRADDDTRKQEQE